MWFRWTATPSHRLWATADLPYLVAWETQDHKAFAPISVVELSQLLILRREAALTRHIDHQDNLALHGESDASPNTLRYACRAEGITTTHSDLSY